MRSLDSYKPSGWDNVSSYMLKICDSSIVTPIKIIFDSCMKTCIYADKWKMSNLRPIYEKDSRHLKENYRQISLLSILSKIFEK